ncbi:MAG TPA: sigma-70 family RNA polymerase sigma factor [Ktedonobacteraceae bacterium]|nr:sigma-70 family RNA polymerase sigma factor [Ktedonobacteraceae bacterium]
MTGVVITMHPRRAWNASEAGEQAPATEIYQRHAQAVLLYLRRYLAIREDAEDLLLEVFLRAIEKQIPLTLPEEEQRAWLLHVARQKLADYYRQRIRHPSVPLNEMSIEQLVADEHSPEHIALRHEDHRLLHERFAALPEQYQTVLWLRFAYGLRSKAIGQQLQKSEGAARTLLCRALNHLRSMYHQGGSPHHDE